MSSERILSRVAILLSSFLLSFLVIDGLDDGSITSKCNEKGNYFNCVMMSKAASNNQKIRSFASHEHDLIPVRVNNSTGWFLICLTCDIYYCKGCGKGCGKVLDSKTDLTLHKKCN